ncbi:MAG: hypothetical protein JWO19_5743, partial [Bryobacterales bacterium]|nr:hypothetical protein [Bryobacterales bacterium]
MRNTLEGLSNACRVISGLLLISGSLVLAQDGGTDPPDAIPSRGFSTTGQYSLSQIESVNALTGNVGLSIPLAHLPPGPAGFSAGVNLMYNSAIYDVAASPSGQNEALTYKAGTHGAGWNYGYRYTLWSQPRLPGLACSGLQTTELYAWFKNFLQTPDGNNHALTLVGMIDHGTTTQHAPGAFVEGLTSPDPQHVAKDPNNAYWMYDIVGQAHQYCNLNIPSFTGTQVYATTDGSYIRVETDSFPDGNGNRTWKAFFPDGTQIGGPITFPGDNAQPSDDTQLTDRNGNTLAITGSCAIGQACTTTLQDTQSRTVTLNYSSNGVGTWTDTITSPGVNTQLTSIVNWQTFTPAPIPYYHLVNFTDGTTVTTSTQSLSLSMPVVTSVQLPAAETGGNATFFSFGYMAAGSNLSWGELHSALTCAGVTLPSCTQQWSVAYAYKFDSLVAPSTQRPPGTAINPISSKVLSYSELRDGTAGPVPLSETTQYTSVITSSVYDYPAVSGTAEIDYPNGTSTFIYTTNLCQPAGLKSRDFCPALPYKIVNPDSSWTEMVWTSNTRPSTVPAAAVVNPYVQYKLHSPPSSPLPVVASGAVMAQDRNGNTTSVNEYDWMTASSGVQRTQAGTFTGITCQGATSPCPARTTTTAFYGAGTNYWDHSAPTFLRAPQSITVGSANTQFTYDNPLTTANLTQVQRWDSAQNQFISRSSTYLANGNVQSTTNPNGIKTLVCYDSNNLYPITRVVASTNSSTCPTPSELPEGRKTTYVTDFNSGLLTSETDADNAITTTYTYDNIGRQKRAEQQGGILDRVTTATYDDVNLVVTTATDDTPTHQLVSTTYFDAMGRVRYSTDGAGNKIQKAYRFGSQVSYELASNPYVSTGDSTMGWTLTTRDSVGRVISIQYYASANAPGGLTSAPGGNSPPAWGSNTVTTGSISTAYNVTTAGCAGPTANVTDEANNTHVNCPDGLGRLASVTEPPVTYPNGTVSTVTKYTYDLLNNLIGVNVVGQPNSTCSVAGVGQTRCFTYSTLSRLTSATNPESGTVQYIYDKNGNLAQQTDAEGTVTTLSTLQIPYDGLDRPRRKSYSVAGHTVATPSVDYAYDADFKGALSSVASTSATTYTHDAFGRIATSTQTTAGNPAYQFSYGYSLTDQLTSITYPSGRQVKYVLDAVDRVMTIQNLNAGTNYATINYTAPGGISTMTTGNGVTQQVSWNDRSQPVGLQVNSASSSSLLALGFSPCPSGQPSCPSGNNGNLRSQTVSAPA